ncbi:MAG: hypothetical protein A3G35_14850 [candidate division NC10 bacterium RIFCSPLOWO2_12_FULL_66_18]|nr:MAG: hypothetical protein A3G35_14850 [candidate division NC10 bacterium RIFCSPLOWO2_12_FULL_66_18]
MGVQADHLGLAEASVLCDEGQVRPVDPPVHRRHTDQLGYRQDLGVNARRHFADPLQDLVEGGGQRVILQANGPVGGHHLHQARDAQSRQHEGQRADLGIDLEADLGAQLDHEPPLPRGQESNRHGSESIGMRVPPGTNPGAIRSAFIARTPPSPWA